MIRKIALCAVIALAPGLALAAGASTPVPADTHAVINADTKTDAVVKGKAVRHTVAHKADAKVKASSTSDSKAESPKP